MRRVFCILMGIILDVSKRSEAVRLALSHKIESMQGLYKVMEVLVELYR